MSFMKESARTVSHCMFEKQMGVNIGSYQNELCFPMFSHSRGRDYQMMWTGQDKDSPLHLR